MRATHFSSISVVLAFVVAAFGAAAAGPSGPAQHVTGYYVCEFDVSAGGTSTTYQSDVIANTGFRPGPVAVAFRDFVNATYHTNGKSSAACSESTTEAMARQVIKSKDATGVKIIKTGWKYTTGPTAAPALAPSVPAPPASTPAGSASPSAATNQGAGSGQDVLCYSDASASPFYLSGDFHIDVPLPPDPRSPQSDGGASRRAIDALQKEFLEYLKADRGYQNTGAYPTTCDGKPRAADLAHMRELLHQRFPQLKFVETGWKPGMKSTATPKPSSTPTAASSPAITAPGKALAAQRPASNTAVTKPSTSPATAAATPAIEVPATYSYCYAYGSTTAGTTAKKRFYISQPFKVSPGERLNQAFEKYLGSAHPGETISASCLSPGPLDAAQKNRQTTVDMRRKQPAQFDVIEVDWKR